MGTESSEPVPSKPHSKERGLCSMGRLPGINNKGAVYPQQGTLEMLLPISHECLCIKAYHNALGN